MNNDLINLPNREATYHLGKEFGATLPAGTVMLLQGDLGVGKTTLVQGIGAGLGINEPIVSPTFTLINEYLEGRIPLYHLDLYRLQPEETAELYLENYWQGIEVELGITAIEWPERLLIKPSSYWLIKLINLGIEGRQVKINKIGN